MISALVWLLVLVAVLAVVWWGIQQLPLPPVAHTVLTVLMVVIAILVIAKVLMSVLGAPPGF